MKKDNNNNHSACYGYISDPNVFWIRPLQSTPIGGFHLRIKRIQWERTIEREDNSFEW